MEKYIILAAEESQYLRYARKRMPLTQQGGECDQPSSYVRKGLYDLLLLQCLIFGAALIVSNALESSDTFFLRQGSGVYRRVWQPEDHAYPNQDGKPAE